MQELARAEALESGQSPLDFLLGVMRDDKQELRDRMDAAKAAAPYVHAKISTVTVAGDTEKPFITEMVVRIVDPKA